MLLGVAGVAGPILLGNSPTEESSSPEVVVGTVSSVDEPDRMAVQTAQGPVGILISQGASLWRDHPASITAFVPGDEVVAEGDWSNGQFAATYMVSLYRLLEAVIVGREDSHLDTTAGVVQLTDDSLPQGGSMLESIPLPELGAGESIVVLGRRDPLASEFIGLRIGVKAGP